MAKRFKTDWPDPIHKRFLELRRTLIGGVGTYRGRRPSIKAARELARKAVRGWIMPDFTLGPDEQAACTIARGVASTLRVPDGVGMSGARQNAANTISTLLTIIDHLTLRLSQAGERS